MVSGGMYEKIDSAAIARRDSIRVTKLADSLKMLPKDSLVVVPDSIRMALPDTLRARIFADSIIGDKRDSLAKAERLRRRAEKRDGKGPFISDSMSLRRVTMCSAVMPGFGQIYNKQYWKLGVLYPVFGSTLGLFIHENKLYKPYKVQYDQYLVDHGYMRTPELDEIQTQMIRHNTRQQIYAGLAIATYIYFIGDAAINYKTNDVSHVKKATTLSTICPGAGQIYNKSYWRVPIVIGGFATTIYCIDWNNRGFQRFKKAYSLRAAYDKAMADYNADPENNPKPTGSTDEFRGRYAASFLKNLRDNYRRNRDLCIIITAGLYILQAIDAHVDAHLQDFDVSDDLSMTIEPKIDYNYIPSVGDHRATYGFSINVNF